MQLLIARSGSAQRELLDTVAGEARVRVAVDEPGNGAQSAAVELHDVAGQGRKVAHETDGLDLPALAEHEGVFEHVHLAQRLPAQRRTAARRRDQLREVANQETRGNVRGLARGCHPPAEGATGGSRPVRSATSMASS